MGFLPSHALSASAPSLEKTWTLTTPNGTPFAEDLTVDSSENITIGGGVQTVQDVGDALLLKYNSSGSLLIQRIWGGSQYEKTTGVAVDAYGNSYLTGRTDSFGAGGLDIFLVKFGPAGNLLWQETYGNSSINLSGATSVDSGGDIIISGDGVLAKFNSSGSLVWQHAWTGTGDSLFGRVMEDASGDIYTVSATYLLKFNFTGGLVWAKSWSGMTGGDISLDASGDLYLTGLSSSSVYLLKLNPDGILLWQQKWQISGWTMTSVGVAANATSIIYVTADMTTCVLNPRGCSNYYRALILEYNSTGSLLGELATQGGGFFELGRPSTDFRGSLYLTGAGGVMGMSFCLPTGGSTTSSVSMATAVGQVLTPSYSVMPVSGTVTTPAGDETSQGGIALLKFDSPISGASATCSAVTVFPLTFPVVTLIGIVIILQARRRRNRSPSVKVSDLHG